jgi:acyl-[acyl-carrier-protein] desaturase
MRHHKAYCTFVDEIFKIDPSNMMVAFKEMMVNKIVMPAQFLRESGQSIGTAFEDFSDSAQRLGVYTAQDYIDIMQKLIEVWDIASIKNLTDEAEKSRDYLMKLPARMQRIAERIKIPQEITRFKWVEMA